MDASDRDEHGDPGERDGDGRRGAPVTPRPGRRRALRRVALTTAAVVVAGGVAVGLGARVGDEPEAARPDRPPSPVPVTAPVVAPAPPAPPQPLPTPSPPPDEPYADVPVERLGSIEVPAIGVEHEVYAGIWLTVLDVGPGHWPGTALPGERGNTVFPGHRTTYTRPFQDLDRLAAGDEVVFRTDDGVHTYAVTESFVVEPTDLWVVDQSEHATMTLVACHPKGSAAQRIVVRGELVASEASADAAATGTALADAIARVPL